MTRPAAVQSARARGGDTKPKSEWGRVCCETERDREAIRSWFPVLADRLTGPTACRQLERIGDGETLKLKALFTNDGGEQVELTRTFGRTFRVSGRRPTQSSLREYSR